MHTINSKENNFVDNLGRGIVGSIKKKRILVKKIVIDFVIRRRIPKIRKGSSISRSAQNPHSLMGCMYLQSTAVTNMM